MFENYLLAILGFLFLLGSGRYLVEGSTSLAKYFGLSTLLIGVTVVAFGTSAPELLVSLQAGVKGHPEISLGNVIGSNISNIALVLAITAIIMPIPVKRQSLFFDWPFMMIISILFYLFGRNFMLGRIEGVIFNVLLIGFIYFSIKRSRKNTDKKNSARPSKSILWKAVIMVVLSSAGLVFGADLLVDNAVFIAKDMGVSERVISITMIAVGTSLPELVTSVMAAIKKEMDISVGNIIGSNIFNILSVLGITSIIKPIQIEPIILNFDILWMLAISLLLFFLLLPFKKPKLSRFDGVILLLVYAFYLYRVFSV